MAFVAVVPAVFAGTAGALAGAGAMAASIGATAAAGYTAYKGAGIIGGALGVGGTAGKILGINSPGGATGANGAPIIDINQLDQQTRAMAKQNALDAQALEQQLTPEVPQLRKQANEGVINSMGGSQYQGAADAMLAAKLGQPIAGDVQTPLLKAAIAKAKSDLGLGGALPQDVRNATTRAALAKSQAVSPGSLSLGRDMTARDLGTTSLALEQQRMNNASQLGAQELGAQTVNTNTAFNNNAAYLNQMQMLTQAGNNAFTRNLQAAQYGQSIAQPQVGMDPAAVGNIAMANASNQTAANASAANVAAAKSNGQNQLIGQLGSAALMAYGMSCWVAREVYGPENPKWLQFRDWMLNRSPEYFRTSYLANGEAFAEVVKKDRLLKERLRNLFDSILDKDSAIA